MGCGASTQPEIFKWIEAGEFEKVRTQLRADPNCTRGQNELGDTALHHAAWMENGDKAKCLEAILEGSSLDKNAINKTGWTPCHLAAAHGKDAAFRMLLSRGAHGETQEPGGATPLHLAAENGHEKCIKAGLECGINKDIQNANKETPLHLVARKGPIECVQALIDGKADVNDMNCGKTPLHEAANNGQTEICRCLIKGGAGSQTVDSNGKTPAQLAAAADFKKLAVELGGAVKEEDMIAGRVAVAMGGGSYHPDDPEGLVPANEDTRKRVQSLMDQTWKGVTTRDRNFQGVTQFEVVAVQQNSCKKLWTQYQQAQEELSLHYVEPLNDIKTVIDEWESLLQMKRRADVNEFFLFHGTKPTAAASICEGGFNVDLSGSNKGSLYGPGIYLAESSAKADEYAGDDTEGVYVGLFAMLLCRVSLGNPIHNTEVEPDVEAISAAFEDTSKHSVVGDREKTRGTYREFIVRNAAQVYPAYAIIYRRKDGKAPLDTE